MWLREMQASGRRQDLSGRIEDPEPTHGSNTSPNTKRRPRVLLRWGQQVAWAHPAVAGLPPPPRPRTRGVVVPTFPLQASPTSFPRAAARRPQPSPGRTSSSAGSGPPPAGTLPQGPVRLPRDHRRRIPAGPRGAKSAPQDGKLQKSWALGPPPRLSRNSRPRRPSRG